MSFPFCARMAACTLALLLLKPIVQACGPSADPTDYYPSFFDSRMVGIGNTDLLQFRYSAYTGMFYDDWYSDYVEPFTIVANDTADGNRAEWGAYTGGLPLADIDSFVYKSSKASLSALYHNLEKSTPAGKQDMLEGNAMTAWFRKQKDLEALGYLMYAKKVEEALRPSEDWEATLVLDSLEIARLQKDGRQLLDAARKPFIKQRYGYQLLKLLFYNGEYAELLRQYNLLAAGATGNIATRMLGLQAGAYYRSGEKTKAAYGYSKVFDSGPEWRHSAAVSYDWCSGSEQTAVVLKQCKTRHERAVIYLLSGLQEYEKALPQLEGIAKEDPTVKGVEALFTREINKAEERYLTDKVTAFFVTNVSLSTPYWEAVLYDNDGTTKPKTPFGPYVDQLAYFGKAQSGRVPVAQRGYWYLATAYLAYLQGNNTLQEAQLALAESATLTSLEREQLSMMQLLQIAKLNAVITPETEAQMIPYLTQLEVRRQNSKMGPKMYRDFTGTYLAGRYLAQQDSVKAIFALVRAAYGQMKEDNADRVDGSSYSDNPGTLLQQLSPAAFEQFKSFSASGTNRRSGKGLSAYDRWLIGKNPYPIESLYELEGTRKVRTYQFTEALKWYAKVPKAEMENYGFPDPFHFDAGHFLYEFVTDSTVLISKIEFAQKMAMLQSKTDAESMFEYGLGLYGMTYYGLANAAYDYNRSNTTFLGYYEGVERKAFTFPDREYYGAYTAEKVFAQAAVATTNKELKAQALFMASKCWQKRAPVIKRTSYYDDGGAYYSRSLNSPYFKTLKDELSGTQAYEDILRKCDFFKDYVNKR